MTWSSAAATYREARSGTGTFGAGMVSRGGSLYAQVVLGVHVHDMTGGFNGWWHYVLAGIGLDNIKSEGYAFQIELKYRAMRTGFTWVEMRNYLHGTPGWTVQDVLAHCG